MTTPLDFDRTARAWLAEGPSELSDSVLDGALREVHRTRQRHPLGVPWGVRPMPLQLRLGAAAIVAVAVVGVVAVTLSGTKSVGPSVPSPTPAVAPTATLVPSPSPAAKMPAATVAELVNRLYAAVHARDSAALHALAQDGKAHLVYSTDGVSGNVVGLFMNATFDFATDPMRDVKVLGEPLIVGDLVMVPVAYTYTGEVDTGFDLFYVAHVGGGLLIGSTVTLYGKPGLTLDPKALKTITAEMAAWNKDDTAGVLATMASDVRFWDGIADPSRVVYSRSEMAGFFTSSSYIDVANIGSAITSGAFIALPQRLTSGRGSEDGITVYEIRGGKIALQVYASGTP